MTFTVLQAVAAALALAIHVVLAAVMLAALLLVIALGVRTLRRQSAGSGDPSQPGRTEDWPQLADSESDQKTSIASP